MQATLEGGCERLYAKDGQDGGRFGRVQIVNPFVLAAQEPPPPPRAGGPAKRRSGRNG